MIKPNDFFLLRNVWNKKVEIINKTTFLPFFKKALFYELLRNRRLTLPLSGIEFCQLTSRFCVRGPMSGQRSMYCSISTFVRPSSMASSVNCDLVSFAIWSSRPSGMSVKKWGNLLNVGERKTFISQVIIESNIFTKYKSYTKDSTNFLFLLG